jgi:X-X-X-Leu-X-X-Gly heptad repeat protein
MLGAGHGRSKRGHLASAYSSGSGRLDTGVVELEDGNKSRSDDMPMVCLSGFT